MAHLKGPAKTVVITIDLKNPRVDGTSNPTYLQGKVSAGDF